MIVEDAILVSAKVSQSFRGQSVRKSKGIVVVGLVGFGMFISGCETSKGPVVVDGPEVARGASEAEDPGDAEALRGAELILRVEELRDQRFRTPPSVVGTRGALPEVAPMAYSPEAIADRQAILRGLFGVKDELSPATSMRQEFAVYDPGTHRITYRAQMGDKGRLDAALVMALVEALESDGSPEPLMAKTWDEALALEAIRRGSGAFVAALHAAGQEGKDSDARALAHRPELAMRLQGMERSLGEGAPSGFADYLEQASRGFALREGLGWTAALYRAGRWSGVEYGRAEGIDHTGYVVRADRWLKGDGLGIWTVPAELEATRLKTGFELTASGYVGPAIIAVWLAQVVDARSARTVYMGWRSDQYKLWERGGEQGGIFEWVSQWDTPHSAHQVAEVIGHAMQKRFAEQASQHVRVIREGVNVAVVVSEGAADGEVLENVATMLARSTVGYMPMEARPLEFVPTELDRYVAAALEATLEEGVWRDPAAGITMDLTALGDWQIQKTDEAGVRWFARHDDGALVQMTTELFDPFAPRFESEAYREGLETAFGQSMGGVPLERFERQESELGPALYFTVQGRVNGAARRLVVWQRLRGEVLVTYSLQSGSSRFAVRAKEAFAALETMRAEGAPALEGSQDMEAEGAGQGDGILEFKVEED